MREVFMRYKAAILSMTAVLAMVGVAGCFSQPRPGASEYQPAQGGAAHAANVSWSGTHKAEVTDPALGMTAFTVDVPNGWKFVGTILRPGGCHPPSTPAMGLSYTSLSPDGLSAYSTLPGVSWTGSSNGYNFQGNKCPSNIKIDSAAGFLLNIAVPNLHRDAESVTLVQLDPKFQAALAANSQQATAHLRQNGLQGKAIQDAAQVRVEYDRNGQPMEDLITAVVDCQETLAQATMGRPYTRLICGTRGTSIIRAPRGQADELKAHRPPFQQINPEWDQRLIEAMRTRFQQLQAASDAQFKAMTAHYAEMNRNLIDRSKAQDAQRQAGTDAAMAADRNTVNATSHAAHQQVLDSLNRADFTDPTTGQRIETSNQFDHNWISSDGSTVVLGDDPTFDPNGVVDPGRQSFIQLIPEN